MKKQHTTRSLVSAMAVIPDVLTAFQKEHAPDYRSLEAQESFAKTIQTQWVSDFGPSKRYLHELVRRYIKLVDENAVESESLLELVMLVVQTKKKSEIPHPDDSCYVSFQIDNDDNCNDSPLLVVSDEARPPPLRIRIFPHHNDVALRVWEAGALLAEYIVANPHWVRNQRVVELGAGAGLTGLVAAGLCQAEHVLCTDYTDVCLENLQHNIELNRMWLQHSTKSAKTSGAEEPLSNLISSSYLEWGDYAFVPDETDDESTAAPATTASILTKSAHCLATTETRKLLDSATVLLGADLAYDWDCIEPLAQTIRRFLQPDTSTAVATPRKKKVALLAATIRNEATFAFLQDKLSREGIASNQIIPRGAHAELPVLFPLKFAQPRSDVTIYSLTITD